jgi:hypothetical protein
VAGLLGLALIHARWYAKKPLSKQKRMQQLYDFYHFKPESIRGKYKVDIFALFLRYIDDAYGYINKSDEDKISFYKDAKQFAEHNLFENDRTTFLDMIDDLLTKSD